MKNFNVSVASALAFGLLANAEQSTQPSVDECNSCAEWAFAELSTHHVNDHHAEKCLDTLAKCSTQGGTVHNKRDLEIAADKQPVKCKECATMFESDSKVQHRDFADCVLLVERGRCPLEFPDGLVDGAPSFDEINSMVQKRGVYPTEPTHSIQPYGPPAKTYGTVEQPKTYIQTQPPATVTSTLTAPPQTETITCTETMTPEATTEYKTETCTETMTADASTEFKTETETCTETTTLEKYFTNTEMESYAVTVPIPTTITATTTEMPECPTITTSCTHWTLSPSQPAYPVTHPSYPVSTKVSESSKPGYHVTYPLEKPSSSEMKSYPVSSSKPSYGAATPTAVIQKATYPASKASTPEGPSYPMTSISMPAMPTAPVTHGNYSVESVPPYYKPSASGHYMTSAHKFSYPTESVVSTGDSSKVSMGMGLAFGAIMAGMFVCA